MADSRGDGETGSELAAAQGACTRGAHDATTVRAAPEQRETLRLGPDAAGAHALPTWASRYEDLGEIARGGMSRIHVVFDRVVRRRVAMKVHDLERDPAGLSQFIEEARITGQLDHPNVIAVHDVQHDPGGLPTRFTMKLVEGETLADVLERLGPEAVASAELERLLGVFVKVCDAVSFAHSRGVIHCDLKPDNVMVGSHGQVYVTDWGAALRRAPPLAQPEDERSMPVGGGALVGTPAYMAPEQALCRRDRIDERTDVYGLGGILYALLTRSPPHDGGSAQGDLELARQGVVAAPEQRAIGRTLPPGLCRIAMRALSPEPDERFASVEALRLEVERFLRGGGWFESLRLPAGATVLREGDLPDAAYILLDGQCELHRQVDGIERFVRSLAAGEVFGEASIFGSSTRTASVIAATDVTLVRVTRDALRRELERTEWLQAFVQALATRFIELDRRVRELEKPDSA